jgi:hypothetical protein
MVQMVFFDLSDRHASFDAKKDPLVDIEAVVPSETFRPALDERRLFEIIGFSAPMFAFCVVATSNC